MPTHLYQTRVGAVGWLSPAVRKPMHHLIHCQNPCSFSCRLSQGQKHNPQGTTVECEADPLLLVLISKDFYFLVKCLWNADLACKWSLSFLRSMLLFMEFGCLWIVHTDTIREKPLQIKYFQMRCFFYLENSKWTLIPGQNFQNGQSVILNYLN